MPKERALGQFTLSVPTSAAAPPASNQLLRRQPPGAASSSRHRAVQRKSGPPACRCLPSGLWARHFQVTDGEIAIGDPRRRFSRRCRPWWGRSPRSDLGLAAIFQVELAREVQAAQSDLIPGLEPAFNQAHVFAPC